MRLSSKWFLSILLQVLLISVIGFLPSKVVSANDMAEESVYASGNEWLNDYTYKVEDGHLYLQQYNGQAEELYVPATVVLNGTEYRVELISNIGDGSSYGESDVSMWSGDPVLKKITFGDHFLFPAGCCALFRECKALEEISLTGTDTSQIVTMQGMFRSCENLKTADLSGLDLKKVETMFDLFGGCKSLTDVNFSNTQTENLVDMGCMFGWAESIETVDLSSLDAGNVTDMNGVFCFCRSLKTFIPPKNVVRVVRVRDLFQNCESLRTVDVSWLEQSELEDMALMFASCFQLEEVRGLTSLKTGKVKNMQQLFQSCRKLKHLDLSGWDVVNVQFAKWMFQNCSSLESVDMSGSAVGERQVRTAVDALTTESMFENCTSLKSVDLSGLNDNPVGHMVNMFAGCESLTDVKMHFTSLLPMTNMAGMFMDCRSLKALDLTWLENVTEPPYKYIIRCGLMLEGCTGLESIDLGFSADNIILDHQHGAYQDLLAPCSNLKVCYVPANVTEDWSIGLTLYELTGESTDLFPKNLQESRPYYTEIGRAEALAQLERFVSRMYTVALGREAEAAGLEDWTGRLIRQETDGAGIAHGFIESDEFHNRNLTDEAYVTVLYHTFFDREPDEAGYRDWMDKLSAGYCRRYVLRGFVNSDEFGNLCDSFGIIRGTYTITEDEEIPHPVIHREKVQAFVTRLYEKCLNREGEPAGIEDWTERIMSGEWEAGDVARIGFFFSEEYQNRARTDEEYVTDMYHAFFDREPDEAGYADWTGQLADGADRLSVIYGFTDSDEFNQLLESYGLQ